jgi:serine phosphatase RsbU (regulator of sigma subunit)
MGYINSLSRLSPWGFFLFVLALSLYGEEIFRNSEVKYAALQKEIITASRIQNAILPPSPPTWEHLKIAVFYQPSHEVGGDFYDFQALGNKKFGILIADVVGHGLGASIIASLSKFSFFQNNTHWRNPSFLMSSMNDDLVKRSQGRFTTASYFYIDFEKMKLIVSSAGHPSFFHWSKSNNIVSEIKPKGKPLGILENLHFVEEDFHFEHGDQFLLYTDGLPEETGTGMDEFGTETLLDLFASVAGTTPEIAVNKIVSTFRAKIGLTGLPHDDITLIYLDVT